MCCPKCVKLTMSTRCRWTTLTGRVRAQRLFGKSGQNQTNRTSAATQDLPIRNSKSKWQENVDRLLDSSSYALCLRSRIQLGPRTSLSSTSELDTLPRHSPRNKQAAGDERSPWRGHIALRHKVIRSFSFVYKMLNEYL